MTKKKVVLVIKNLETDQNNFCEKRYSAFATWFNFSVNKKKITKLNSLPT
jgi:hypothetical protein